MKRKFLRGYFINLYNSKQFPNPYHITMTLAELVYKQRRQLPHMFPDDDDMRADADQAMLDELEEHGQKTMPIDMDYSQNDLTTGRI